MTTQLRRPRPVDRRRLLCAVMASAGLAAGCDLFTTEPTGSERSGGSRSAGRGQEAPALAAQVKDGELPPLAKRLPDKPLVVKPAERVGAYGGEWRTAIAGPADGVWLTRTIGYENLVRWKPGVEQFTLDEVIPNIAESFEPDSEGRVYTFQLREGMRWSDGEPFTADDIMFWYEDVLMNEELTPAVPPLFVAGGQPVVVERLDDLSVRFTFAEPNGLFLLYLATPVGAEAPTGHPAHYLKQFHKKYNPDIDALVEEEGLENWMDLFSSKAGSWANQELPTLHGWVVTNPLGESLSKVVAERNPYYWKVDSQGRQLPYIDRVSYAVISDDETMLLKALNGEIDMQDFHIASLQNKPVLARSRDDGNYGFYDRQPADMNQTIIQLNLSHPDQAMRQIFQNKDFRAGLSQAINRQEIIDTVYASQGEPYQGAPRPESKFYNERLATQYTEYDVDAANGLLDNVLPNKNAQGVRLGPDGEPFFFVVEVAPIGPHPEWVDVMDLVKGYWKNVGITIQIKNEARELWAERRITNQIDAGVWQGRGGLEILLDPGYYLPLHTRGPQHLDYARGWVTWFDDPEAEIAVEPPATVKEQVDLYHQLERTADQQEQEDLMNQVLEIAADEFYLIGIALPTQGYGVVKNDFHNVPKTMVDAWLYPNPAPTNPVQYFIEE